MSSIGKMMVVQTLPIRLISRFNEAANLQHTIGVEVSHNIDLAIEPK
jgi:hypothetical protein